MSSLVISIIGDDRPGLVSAVSAPVEARGGSWQRSQLARLGGKFAGIVLVEVPDAAVADLESDLAALSDVGLEVRMTPVEPAEPSRAGQWRLHLLGQDRPGIVAEVSSALAAHGVSIDDMGTTVSEAPMAGGLLFEVDAALSISESTDVAAVRASLEHLADELMVDLDLSEE